MRGIRITLTNRQSTLPLDARRLIAAVRTVLREAGTRHATVSIVVVDDAAIWELNRRFLGHDYPTDVLSFPLEQGEDGLEGELIVSADTAAARCAEFGWSAADELLLYVVHGALHLVGYNDRSPRQRAAMRRQERALLGQLGAAVPSLSK